MPPQIIVVRSAAGQFAVFWKTNPPSTPEQAKIEPTERSIPPEMIIKVSPAAMMPITAV